MEQMVSIAFVIFEIFDLCTLLTAESNFIK